MSLWSATLGKCLDNRGCSFIANQILPYGVIPAARVIDKTPIPDAVQNAAVATTNYVAPALSNYSGLPALTVPDFKFPDFSLPDFKFPDLGGVANKALLGLGLTAAILLLRK